MAALRRPVGLERRRGLIEGLAPDVAIDRHHRRRDVPELRADDPVGHALLGQPASAPYDGHRETAHGAGRRPCEATARPCATTSWAGLDPGAGAGRATGTGSAQASAKPRRAAQPCSSRSASRHVSLSDGSRQPAGVLDRRIERRRSSQDTCFHCSALISHARRPQKKSSVAATYAKNQAGFDFADLEQSA